MENKRKNYPNHRPYQHIQLKTLLLLLKEKITTKSGIEIIEEIELRID